MKNFIKVLAIVILIWITIGVIMFAAGEWDMTPYLITTGIFFLVILLSAFVFRKIKKHREEEKRKAEKLEEVRLANLELQHAQEQFTAYKNGSDKSVSVEMLQIFFKGRLSKEDKEFIFLHFDFKSLVTISDLKKQIVWNDDILRCGLSTLEQAVKSSYDDEFIQGILDNFVDFLDEEISPRKQYAGTNSFLNYVKKSCPTIMDLMKGES